MPHMKSYGAYCFTVVRLSAQTLYENLTFSSYYFSNLVTLLILGIKTSHRYTAGGTKVKLICQGQILRSHF